MESINPYLELLKEELIAICTIADPSINTLHELKKKEFESMFRIIQSTLEKSELLPDSQKSKGNTTVSVSTLERIFKYGYVPELGDSRVINTLNKLATFLGYAGWKTFISMKQVQLNITDVSIEEVLAGVVRNANQAEYDAYKALPEIQTVELQKYLTTTGTAYKRIYNILVMHNKKLWVLNNEDNPSGYKVYKLWIESINSREAIIKTKEYWYLRWYEMPTARYCDIYDEENVQTWTLQFDNGIWKVASTYYPPRTK